jgi:transcriptional regulator with XRE-family HTH domain
MYRDTIESLIQPERTKELVDQLRAWYKNGTTRQMDLAAALGLKRQQLAEILSGRNRPTGEQTLIIQDFLKDKPMTQSPLQPL